MATKKDQKEALVDQFNAGLGPDITTNVRPIAEGTAKIALETQKAIQNILNEAIEINRNRFDKDVRAAASLMATDPENKPHPSFLSSTPAEQSRAIQAVAKTVTENLINPAIAQNEADKDADKQERQEARQEALKTGLEKALQDEGVLERKEGPRPK